MLRFLVLFVLFGLIYSEGYWDIQLSPQSIASVPFARGHVSVWQHANTRGRYYAMPLVYLLNDSAKVKSNVLTRVKEMSFDVLMWSLEAREAVYLYLKNNVNATITKDSVEMLPMEKIRIVWKDRIRPIAPEFKLVDNWKSNTHLPALVSFQFTCETREACEDLMNAMKASPELFSALELEYVINGQRSSRRSLTVTGRHIVQGKLWTKMATMTEAGDTRYLSSDDLKTITSESVSNVIASLTTDEDYIDTGDEVNMNDVIQHVLGRQEVSTTNFQPQQWNSVFWDPIWTRPDKLTRYLNQVLEKDTSDSRKFVLNEEARSRSAEGGAGGSFLGIISVSGSGGSSSNSQSKVQKEDVLNTLRERHSNIEWNGEQFTVKPMKLFRLNLSNLNTSNNIATVNIQIRRYEAVHTIKLRLTDSTEQTPNLTPQLVESRLLEKLEAKAAQITQQTDTKIQSVNRKIETKDNEGRARLVPLQNKLNTLPGWPVGGYCILAKGTCPPGFTRHRGHILAISTYSHTPTYIGVQHFGDSYIKCHGRCGQYGNWNAEIILVYMDSDDQLTSVSVSSASKPSPVVFSRTERWRMLLTSHVTQPVIGQSKGMPKLPLRWNIG